VGSFPHFLYRLSTYLPEFCLYSSALQTAVCPMGCHSPMASFREHLASFRKHLASFREHLAWFREHLASFREHLASLREHLASFREHLAFFREHLASFREHLASLSRCRHPPIGTSSADDWHRSGNTWHPSGNIWHRCIDVGICQLTHQQLRFRAHSFFVQGTFGILQGTFGIVQGTFV
jgi:hypothetical protein